MLAATQLRAADDGNAKCAKATLALMETAGTAIIAYITDFDASPDAKTVAELRSKLQPTYIRDLQAEDGWGTPLRYMKTGTKSFLVISAGADRKFDESSWRKPAQTKDLAADAVFESTDEDQAGQFTRVWVETSRR